uniref:(northern house mosquito) hypothetical protein n=1 Tax=Culex pipiens TaxID=7175 RepID=A0A8D8FI51_CULPI
MDPVGRTGRADHHSDPGACVADIRNGSQDRQKSRLYNRTHHRWPEPKVREESVASAEHNHLHSGSVAAAHGHEPAVRLHQPEGACPRRSGPLPGHGLPDGHECHNRKSANDATNVALLGHANQIRQRPGAAQPHRSRVHCAPREGRVHDPEPAAAKLRYG